MSLFVTKPLVSTQFKEYFVEQCIIGIGFIFGDALSATSQAKLENIIESFDKDLTTLFKGPINFQDGTNYVPASGNPTLNDIWYTPQLLEGMTGDSA